MILINPYQFKPLELQYDPRIIEHVNRYIITDYANMQNNQLYRVNNFDTPTGTLKPVILYGTTESEKEVPSFKHPVINHKNNWIALDLRGYVRQSEKGGPVQAKNASDIGLVLTRFVLTGLWLEERQTAVYGLKLAHISFAEWLSSNLVRKFGLNITDQIKLFTLAAIYYRSLFTNSFNEEDLDKLKLRLQGEIFVPSIIDEVASIALPLESIDDFCTACYKVTNSPRLQGFSLGVLMNVLTNNWFGTDGQELTTLSLVHPPTWVSLVDASMRSRSYRNNYIAKVVDGKNKKGAGAEFLQAITPLVRLKLGD